MTLDGKMGRIKTALPVKYFIAITYIQGFDVESLIRKTLTEQFGVTDFRSEQYDFSSFTNYYSAEMADKLQKLFVSFRDLRAPDYLPEMKLRTNHLEQMFTDKGKRIINLDPGYLTRAKIILATTKDYSHRIYLCNGIYGDLHLYYARKSFQKQPWTYPDYQRPQSLLFFNQLRVIYSQQLAGEKIEENNL